MLGLFNNCSSICGQIVHHFWTVLASLFKIFSTLILALICVLMFALILVDVGPKMVPKAHPFGTLSDRKTSNSRIVRNSQSFQEPFCWFKLSFQRVWNNFDPINRVIVNLSWIYHGFYSIGDIILHDLGIHHTILQGLVGQQYSSPGLKKCSIVLETHWW